MRKRERLGKRESERWNLGRVVGYHLQIERELCTESFEREMLGIVIFFVFVIDGLCCVCIWLNWISGHIF